MGHNLHDMDLEDRREILEGIIEPAGMGKTKAVSDEMEAEVDEAAVVRPAGT